MRIGILGPLQVWTPEGHPIEIGGGRPRVLLARLAIDPGRPVPVDALVDALWEDDPPAAVGNALQAVVSRLRRALQAAEPDGGAPTLAIESHHAGYRVDVGKDDVDAHRFEKLARTGRQALRTGDPLTAKETLTAALDLWRGPLLVDLGDASFVAAAAARFDKLRLSVVEDRIEASLLLGGHADVVAELEGLAGEYPLRERIRGLLMRALAASGRQAEALDVYEQTRRRLVDELGIDPSPELQDIHLAALRGELAAPALAGGDDPPAGSHLTPPGDPTSQLSRPVLPTRRTSFVGRGSDVEALVAAIGQSRAITLHGPGGAGKTRLAIESARHLAEDPSTVGGDGVWFVELASVADHLEVAPALLTVLGLGEVTTASVDTMRDRLPVSRDAAGRLAEALRDKDAVLVLDNCEHLISAVAALADTLLSSCRRLRLLATSREPLGVEGEVLFPVGPLPLPDSAAELSPESASDYAAVQLFVDRAVAVRPGFRLDEATVPAVVEVCRRLDGMPLAIELAAARVRALSPEQIEERLDDRFRLLTNGGRTALPRQQTLRAVVEWSWDLLEEPERLLVSRLSVFSGGASLDAVERICAGPGVATEDVLDTVASLVDKSLVEAGSDGSSREVRYRLLETVRAYAAEQLAATGKTESFARRHAEYFGDLLERAEPYLRRAEQLEWIARISGDYDNILGALRWAIDNVETDLAVRITAPLGYFWMLRGGRRESGMWLRQTLALPDEVPTARRALVQFFDAANTFSEGDIPNGIRSFARARLICRRTSPDSSFPVHALVETMWLAAMDGRPSARELLPTSDDPWMRAVIYSAGMFLADTDGDIETRDQQMERAMAEFSAVGDRMGMAMLARTKASFLGFAGDHVAGVRMLEEALRWSRELGTVDDVPVLLAEMGRHYAQLRDLPAARRVLEAGYAEACRSGATAATVAVDAARGWLAYREGDVETALDLLGRARSSCGVDDPGEVYIRTDLADVQLAAGQVEEAREVVTEGLELILNRSTRALAGAPDLVSLARLTQSWAAIELAEGRPVVAAQLLGVCLAVRGAMDMGSAERAATERHTRLVLGDEAYERAFASGAAMPRAEAVRLVRDVTGVTVPEPSRSPMPVATARG
ncbi:AfsR/SARP family transcriptional regulator [Phytoactinopolyspora limicola]|uniref:AfsR/SARP family transcriptional regulator n=1 Tax=Phytoactinopolyspora limicola TaxID=2715536 RepID=UPI0014093A70|nr:BTAD domain-containing putative transcriptional regulator [Phytoactinopolyspora limicola]